MGTEIKTLFLRYSHEFVITVSVIAKFDRKKIFLFFSNNIFLMAFYWQRKSVFFPLRLLLSFSLTFLKIDQRDVLIFCAFLFSYFLIIPNISITYFPHFCLYYFLLILMLRHFSDTALFSFWILNENVLIHTEIKQYFTSILFYKTTI